MALRLYVKYTARFQTLAMTQAQAALAARKGD
jgi:hypothetical protein